MMQIRDEMTMLRYRSGNNFSCPMVIRVADRRLPARRRAVSQPVGREHLRALPGHSHRLSVERASTRPACCAPRSAATIRCCSSSTSTSTARPTTRAPYPGKDFMIPFGKASAAPRRRPTCWSSPGARWCSDRCWRRSRRRSEGISVAVIDLRTIVPYDWDGDRRARQAHQPGRRRPRGSAHVRLRRRDRGADRRRAVRASRRAGPARRRARHAGRLQPGPRRRRSCPARRPAAAIVETARVLTIRQTP